MAAQGTCGTTSPAPLWPGARCVWRMARFSTMATRLGGWKSQKLETDQCVVSCVQHRGACVSGWPASTQKWPGDDRHHHGVSFGHRRCGSLPKHCGGSGFLWGRWVGLNHLWWFSDLCTSQCKHKVISLLVLSSVQCTHVRTVSGETAELMPAGIRLPLAPIGHILGLDFA